MKKIDITPIIKSRLTAGERIKNHLISAFKRAQKTGKPQRIYSVVNTPQFKKLIDYAMPDGHTIRRDIWPYQTPPYINMAVTVEKDARKTP